MSERPPAAASSSIVRFSVFEFDRETGELWKAGRKSKLPEQARQVLRVLVDRAGELVTRDELQRMLWPEDTFVDFDTGLNVVINKIRQALDDSASTPRFVETLPRRGYRFIAPLVPREAVAAPRLEADDGSHEKAWRPAQVAWLVTALLAVVAIAAFLGLRQSTRSANPATAIQSLAVIPFDNLSGDEAQSYLIEGIVEALTTDLASVQALRVVPRQTMKGYHGTTKSVATIGRELGVDAIIQGSVLRSEDRIQLSVQLIDAASERYLWTGKYDHHVRDMLVMQREAAEAIVDQIHITLSPPERARLTATHVIDPAAYDAYLRGRYLLGGLAETEAQTSRALAEFEQAVSIDPNFAAAYAGIARAQQLRSTVFQGQPPSTIRGPALKAARRALALDPNLADAHAVLARLQLSEFDWPGAEASFRRAFALGVNDSSTLVWYAYELLFQNRQSEALETARRAEALDPLDLNTRVRVAFVHELAGEYDQAVRRLEEVLALDPDRAIAIWFLSSAYIHVNRCDDGLALMRRAMEQHGRTPSMLSTFAAINGAAGRQKDGQEAMAELTAIARRQYVPAALFAVGYTALRDRDRAFEWLERAYQERSNLLVYISIHPLLASLRDDVRFAALEKKVHQPHVPREGP